MSTPASISDVETNRTGSSLFSRSRSVANSRRRWRGHISVVRWAAPGSSRIASNSARAWARLLTMHSICGCSAKRAAIVSFATRSVRCSTFTRFEARVKVFRLGRELAGVVDRKAVRKPILLPQGRLLWRCTVRRWRCSWRSVPGAPPCTGAAAGSAGSAPRRARSRCRPGCAACGTARCARANRLLEELHRGGDDDRHVPVLRRAAQFRQAVGPLAIVPPRLGRALPIKAGRGAPEPCRGYSAPPGIPRRSAR